MTLFSVSYALLHLEFTLNSLQQLRHTRGNFLLFSRMLLISRDLFILQETFLTQSDRVSAPFGASSVSWGCLLLATVTWVTYFSNPPTPFNHEHNTSSRLCVVLKFMVIHWGRQSRTLGWASISLVETVLPSLGEWELNDTHLGQVQGCRSQEPMKALQLMLEPNSPVHSMSIQTLVTSSLHTSQWLRTELTERIFRHSTNSVQRQIYIKKDYCLEAVSPKLSLEHHSRWQQVTESPRPPQSWCPEALLCTGAPSPHPVSGKFFLGHWGSKQPSCELTHPHGYLSSV